MLRDLGVEYVILGHSERRKYSGETDEIINKKIKEALTANLKVILCVGETDHEKPDKSQGHFDGPATMPAGQALGGGKKGEVLKQQLKQALQEIKTDELKNVAIAYEPVWAIGTENNCSP
ncbi:MAG: triosephosphate isomerase, partial [Parcubacteria group bacterium Gr01-1014_48]